MSRETIADLQLQSTAITHALLSCTCTQPVAPVAYSHCSCTYIFAFQLWHVAPRSTLMGPPVVTATAQ